jgi:hypothetical protein
MRLIRKLVVVTAVMAAAFCSTQATALAAPAHAANTAQVQVRVSPAIPRITPLTDDRCNYSAGNDSQICLEIVGGGLYVDEMNVGIANINAGNDVSYFAAIVGPGGFNRATQPVELDEFQGITFTFPIDADLPAGTYTAVLYEWNSDAGEWIQIAATSCPVES